MKLYLASITDREFLKDLLRPDIYILDSFYRLKNGSWVNDLIKRNFFNDFLLDSGAFTFMENTDKVDFSNYLNKYIDFIQKFNITKFFELDIDSVVGVDKVREFRDRLESAVGMDSIPVWHRSRGKDTFIDLCKEYSNVAIGGIVSGEITGSEYKYFPWFIRKAHKNGANIHGLGVTSKTIIKNYNFDSVDSTSWKGDRWGTVYKFQSGEIMQYTKENHRTKHYKEVARHNFQEWVKFQKYLDNGSTQKPAKQTKTIEE